MVGILAALALVLSVVSAGINAKTIYEIETDRSYVAAADKLLRETRLKVDSQLAAARARGDAVAVAQAEALRDSLRLIESRSNVAAIGRQVEQTKDSFRDEQWRQFQADLALRGLSAGAGKIGFGKVRDSYIRGTNWPPDPSKSFVIFDPKSRQAVRVMLETNRPSLDVIRFEDDLEDALSIVLTGYDVLNSTAGSGGQPRTAGEALGQIREGLERLGDVRPLPGDVGGYLAASLARQAQKDNPQIAGLPADQQAAFLRDQACSRLRGIQANESDPQRTEVLRSAQGQLGCRPPATAGTTKATPRPLVVASAVAKVAQSQATPSPATRNALPTPRPRATTRPTAMPTPRATAAAQATPTPNTSWVGGVVADVRSALERGGVPPEVADIYIESLRDCLLDGARSGLSRAEAISRCQSDVPQPQATAVPQARDVIAVDGTFEMVPLRTGTLSWQGSGSIRFAANRALGKAEGILEGKYRFGGTFETATVPPLSGDNNGNATYQATLVGTFDPGSGDVSMTGEISGRLITSSANCRSYDKPAKCPEGRTMILSGRVTVKGKVNPDGTGSGSLTLAFKDRRDPWNGSWKSR